MRINSTVALVTGGGAGLGAATADYLESRGSRVTRLDTRFPAATGTHDLVGDITDAEGIESAFAQVAAAHGRLDVVLHCAGIADGFRLLSSSGAADPARFRRMVEVNLVGTFNVVRAAALAMQHNPAGPDGARGVIILTASVAAFEGQQGQVAYAATKAGVVGMTLPVARDLARTGIRCVTIAPGAFATTLTTDLQPTVQDSLVASTTFPRRLGAPDEFAALVASIVENDYLNAEVIRLDAGTRLSSL